MDEGERAESGEVIYAGLPSQPSTASAEPASERAEPTGADPCPPSCPQAWGSAGVLFGLIPVPPIRLSLSFYSVVVQSPAEELGGNIDI